MRKKILLIAPPAVGLKEPLSYPPLGLLYVAGNLPRDVWDVDVKIMLDDKFEDYDYEYYGVSVHSLAVVKAARELIDKIIAYNPRAKILVGGSGAMLFNDSKNIQVYQGEFEPYLKIDTSNLDNIKFPARGLVPYNHIHYVGGVHHSEKPSTTMIATRGCPFNCAFCDRSITGRTFRKRSPENIQLEIALLKNKYNIRHIRFIDDCLTVDRKWFKSFLNMILFEDITWTCMSRADVLDIPTLEKMKAAGCTEIFFGFESGSQKILNLMNKRTSVEKNKKAVEMCKKVGITCCSYMMFGFPGEDSKSVDDTIRFLEETKPDKSRISTYVPIPGTAVWTNPAKFGVQIDTNYQDFWYFDSHKLGMKYNYITESEMNKLRAKVMGYYKQNYTETWTK